MSIIHVDGKKYIVKETDNLLQACLSVGLDIPYFCWHPALGSIGACRQCAIKQFQNSEDNIGRIVMSCMTPACNGSIISINDKEAKQFRKNIIELLMINHPHDCPVCEEGGNCHLQDMTVMTGHKIRRYRFTKRTYQNQDLSPFISHEMNRCITCYRCIRYYNDYADGKNLGVYGANNNIYFGCGEGEILENEFSGNLIEICPTGVFTDKTSLKKYNRKWDIQFSPSICQHCSIGCNISVGERYGEICKIDNRYNGSINHYFLCDMGRFSYDYINNKTRLNQPMYLQGCNWNTINLEQAVDLAADIIKQSKRIIGIGSSRASIESNFALKKLVGAKNFSTGDLKIEQECIEMVIKILNDGGLYTPSSSEIENYDAILILGEDISQVGTRIALSVRQAIKSKRSKIAEQNKIPYWNATAVFNSGQYNKYPLFLTGVKKTKLDDLATWSYYASIEDQARFGFALAHELYSQAPVVDGIKSDLKNQVHQVAQALINAKKPLIISGTHSGSVAIIEASANIAKALKYRGIKVGITLLVSNVNSIGLNLIGGNDLETSLEQFNKGEADLLMIMENDLYRQAPKSLLDTILSNPNNVIVIDHQNTFTAQKAGLILSTTSYAESSGTVINYEGRAQRFFQVYDPSYYDNKVIMPTSWYWLHSIDSKIKNTQSLWKNLDDVIDCIIKELPHLKGIKDAAPDSNFRVHGQKLARVPFRASGRTAVRANINVHEPRQPQDINTMFAFSMEGNNESKRPCSQIPFAWAPGWNSNQAWNKFQNQIGGHLYNGDPGTHIFHNNDDKKSLPWFKFKSTSLIDHDMMRLVPIYHFLSSKEMFQYSLTLTQLTFKPVLVLNNKDAIRLGFKEDTIVEFNCINETWRFPIKLSSTIQAGLVGIPIGMPGIPLFLINKQICGLRMIVD
ncbi:NADH-quinone oxidoreductase subunit G [Candidatus Pantoea edessiphila]|uniref:NADH-quinone oxidoreductase n=1 Tax=Candidatus Pantoea edessiphila TaxID=2044610 RepID=A0A2P5SYI3_9GAMM|nr:NADH-quinone oxidoreductase subunit NuoG [Candidatus Pantoea edessiphila]MBK4775472.1 NADH-quinone oxidoreductase subunit NuoG [Pantoea sp. Edef]PPI87399.1 NADH-quinone oxidoreductase subunit G [Candidatus Pantoea edessiphila]